MTLREYFDYLPITLYQAQILNLLTQSNCQIQMIILTSWESSNSQIKIRNMVLLEIFDSQIQIVFLLETSNGKYLFWYCLTKKLLNSNRKVLNLILVKIIV